MLARQKEQENMAQVEKQNIEMIEAFLAQLPDLKYDRALDVGAGDGRVTKELLQRLFAAVDLLEPDKDNFHQIKQIKPLLPKLKDAAQASMQDYEFKVKYSLILLCWCAGYEDDDQLEAFLGRAKEHLAQSVKRPTRKHGPDACVVVFDNISDAGEGTLWRQKQRIREEATFGKIFA